VDARRYVRCWVVLGCVGLCWVVVCRGMSWYVVVCGGMSWYVVVCGGMWWYVVVCRGMLCYVVVCGRMSLSEGQRVRGSGWQSGGRDKSLKNGFEVDVVVCRDMWCGDGVGVCETVLKMMVSALRQYSEVGMLQTLSALNSMVGAVEAVEGKTKKKKGGRGVGRAEAPVLVKYLDDEKVTGGLVEDMGGVLNGFRYVSLVCHRAPDDIVEHIGDRILRCFDDKFYPWLLDPSLLEPVGEYVKVSALGGSRLVDTRRGDRVI
jgi:hypothetical protein